MTKLFSGLLAIALVVAFVGFAGANTAQAQNTFPAGCGSMYGYSATTGSPCNSTGIATNVFPAGCTNALGYSGSTGQTCSGTDEPMFFLNGCTSIYGYSAVSGAPCNDTSVAEFAPVITPAVVTTTPGLPTTGAGGEAPLNIALLVGSFALALLGTMYLLKPSRITQQ